MARKQKIKRNLYGLPSKAPIILMIILMFQALPASDESSPAAAAAEAKVAASLTFLELRLPMELDIRLDKFRGCRLETAEATEFEAELSPEVTVEEAARGHRLGFCGKLATGMCLFEAEAAVAAAEVEACGAHISSPWPARWVAAAAAAALCLRFPSKISCARISFLLDSSEAKLIPWLRVEAKRLEEAEELYGGCSS